MHPCATPRIISEQRPTGHHDPKGQTAPKGEAGRHRALLILTTKRCPSHSIHALICSFADQRREDGEPTELLGAVPCEHCCCFLALEVSRHSLRFQQQLPESQPIVLQQEFARGDTWCQTRRRLFIFKQAGKKKEVWGVALLFFFLYQRSHSTYFRLCFFVIVTRSYKNARRERVNNPHFNMTKHDKNLHTPCLSARPPNAKFLKRELCCEPTPGQS